jgi:hypothetical protein
VGAVFLKVGAKAVGESQFRAILKGELARRNDEIKITGPKQWCNYQRGNLQTLGVKGVFVETPAAPRSHPNATVTARGGTFVVPVSESLWTLSLIAAQPT